MSNTVCGVPYTTPDLSFQCGTDDAMGQQWTIHNWYSSTDGSNGDENGNVSWPNTFQSACSLLQGPGEWNWDTTQIAVEDKDHIATGVNGLPVMVSSDATCTNYVKHGYVNPLCYRIAFNGDPTDCCISNVNTTGTCSINNYTCDPQYRDALNNGCDQTMIDYCTNAIYTADWAPTGICMNYFVNRLFNTREPVTITESDPNTCNYKYSTRYDSDGLYQVNKLMASVFQAYTSTYDLGAPINSSKHNDFEDTLMSICCQYSGACDLALNQQCYNKEVSSVTSNQGLAKWCGCNMSQDYYSNYSNSFNLPKECTPLCSIPGVIRNGDVNTNGPITCTSNICMIEGTTINLINSSVGNIDIENICSGCTSGICNCIVADNKFDITNSVIEGKFVPVKQQCVNTTCNYSNTSGTGPNTITNDCSTMGTGISVTSERTEIYTIAYAAGIVLFFLVILVIGIVLVIRTSRKKNDRD